MGRALNIRDPETYRMVAELARHRGTSMAEAIHDTVAKALAEIEADADRQFDDWLDRMNQVQGDCGIDAALDRSQWPIKDI